MDPFIGIKGDLENRVPGVEMSVDRPAKEGGCWWLDVRWKGKTVVVQWFNDGRPVKFGVSTIDDESYFTHQPDEVFVDDMSTSARVLELLGV